jgi:hypothetical protein
MPDWRINSSSGGPTGRHNVTVCGAEDSSFFGIGHLANSVPAYPSTLAYPLVNEIFTNTVEE